MKVQHQGNWVHSTPETLKTVKLPKKKNKWCTPQYYEIKHPAVIQEATTAASIWRIRFELGQSFWINMNK